MFFCILSYIFSIFADEFLNTVTLGHKDICLIWEENDHPGSAPLAVEERFQAHAELMPQDF